jgi:hypothetical protein
LEIPLLTIASMAKMPGSLSGFVMLHIGAPITTPAQRCRDESMIYRGAQSQRCDTSGTLEEPDEDERVAASRNVSARGSGREGPGDSGRRGTECVCAMASEATAADPRGGNRHPCQPQLSQT